MRVLTTLDVAKRAAVTLVAASAVIGCSNDVKTSQPGTEPVATSDQQLISDNVRRRDCTSNPPPDPPDPPPSPRDCGATDTTPCRVTTAFTAGRFRDLQSAIDAAPDGDVITVMGMCPGATVDGRTNLTIQGMMPSTGCGFNGPSPSLLRGEVQGLEVEDSINISVRFLNLVNSGGDGLAFDGATTPLVTCNCAAFNGNDGIRMTDTTAAVISQTLDEANATGIESNGTTTIVISNNTVTANSGNGIFVANASNNNVSFNIVTNNGGDGILFSNSNNNLASGNTIRGNGDGLVDMVVCENSTVFGSNAGRNCMRFFF